MIPHGEEERTWALRPNGLVLESLLLTSCVILVGFLCLSQLVSSLVLI